MLALRHLLLPLLAVLLSVALASALPGGNRMQQQFRFARAPARGRAFRFNGHSEC